MAGAAESGADGGDEEQPARVAAERRSRRATARTPADPPRRS
jgi:hypothetical protein